MSENSIDALLAWMRRNPELLSWNVIAALPLHQIDDLLQQAHLARLSQGTDIQGISGTVSIPESRISHVLDGYRLGAPSLEFTGDAYEQPRISVAMTVEGGTHRVVEAPGKILALSVHDPLAPLQVRQDLRLQSGPQGVVMDLGEGQNVEFDLGSGLPEKLAGGRFIQQELGKLDDARRIHALARVLAGETNAFLDVGGLGVRVHASKNGQRLALVLFISMIHGPTGRFPAKDSDFPFLLPDELAAGHSSTVLMSLRVLHRAAYGHGLLGLLDAGDFDFDYDISRDLANMQARSGSLPVSPSQYSSQRLEFQSDRFELSATAGEQPLTATFFEDAVTQDWKSRCSFGFRYRPVSGGAWQERAATFEVSLAYHFYLNADDTFENILRGEVFSPVQEGAWARVLEGLPEDTDPALRGEIELFAAHIIRSAFLEALSRQLTAQIPELLLDGLQLADASRLRPVLREQPHDLALFGPVGQDQAGFAIAGQNLQVVAGDRQQLSVQPAREGLRWSLESLPGNAADIGRIDAETGLYRAPPAHAMGDGPSRLLVIATDPQTQERAVASITALAYPISVNPLISVCFSGETVALGAGTIGQGPLTWSIKDAAAGSGSLQPGAQGRTCLYQAGPVIPDDTYVLDRIEVRNEQAGTERSVHVLVQQKVPALMLSIAEQALPDGRLQLLASLNGQLIEPDDWQVRLGPGGIDADGCYTPGALAGERFALVTALLDGGKYGLFEGHLILPLPLAPISAAQGTSASLMQQSRP